MALSFLKLLGFGAIITYFLLMLFLQGDKNRKYLVFILFSYPVLHINIFNNFTVFDVVSVIHLIIFARSNRLKKAELNIYNFFVVVLFLNFITGYLLSSFTIDNDNFIRLARFFIILIFPLVLISTMYHDRDFMYSIQKKFPYLVMICLGFLFLQIIIGLNFSLVKTLNPNVTIANGIRYPGIFSDPQQFAQFLGASSFLLLIRFDPNEKIKKINWILFAGCIVAILAAGGRAGFMGWGLGLFLFIFFSKPQYKIAILSLSLILGIVIFFFQDKLAIFNRGTDLQDTYDFRAQIWYQAFQIFLNNPLFGIGLGNYSDYVLIHCPEQVWIVNNEFIAFDHPESGYLLFLTELGGIGFICIMTIILLPIGRALLAYFKTKDINHILFISALLCWMVGFYSTDSLGDVRMKIIVAFILGGMVAYRLVQNDQLENYQELEEDEENEWEENNIKNIEA
jgi:O-antigen ligase